MNTESLLRPPVAGMVSSSAQDDLDGQAFRRALESLATGWILLTAQGPDGSLAGAACQALETVSLSPPRLQWRLPRDAAGLPVFDQASHFAVNVMGEDQLALARHFAQPGAGKFATIAFEFGEGGAPLLEGAVATLECASQARDAGADGLVLTGRVLKYRQACLEPLSLSTGVPPNV
jgi:flavin reductase (DIM6/NTAB) family NADH-FMN oxidoreductase RutF